MTVFKLSYDRILQGKFNLGELNLFFVFQVNCPGCFLYGFPQMERVYQQYKSQGINVLGISTAFEDFEYNTAANVELLLADRQTVGATKQAIGEIYHQEINFPIASDRSTTGTELATPENIEFICQQVADYENMSLDLNARLQQKITFNLSQYPRTSATFTLNSLRGTPSIVLCDRHLQILARWFGHESDANICAEIDICIDICKEIAIGTQTNLLTRSNSISRS
jgi:hypothetical protein